MLRPDELLRQVSYHPSLTLGEILVDFQALCEIADRELNVGLADKKVVERAFREAKGVEAYARQIFWRLRAKQLQELRETEGESQIRLLLDEIVDREKRLRRRKESHRWFWAIACVVGMLGATVFPWFAFRAISTNAPAMFVFAVLSVASLALAVFAFIASRYHTHTE